MYTTLATKSCIRCCNLLVRLQSSSSEPNYRQLAEYNNNPYKELFSHGKKPRTYRERYIEKIRNAPKPRIGVGDPTTDFLHIKRRVDDRKHSFYKGNLRTSFIELGVLPELSHQIAELGVVHPTHHQSDVIPVLLKGRNCVFVSPTGSGKTYTFLLSTIQSLLESNKQGYITKVRAPRIIIMTPTKELALQTGLVTQHLIQDIDLRTLCLTEHSKPGQLKALDKAPTDILIGTYHNIETYIKSGTISTSDLQHLVIDEIDNFVDPRTISEREVLLKELVVQDEGTTRCQIIMTSAILSQAGFNTLSGIIPDLRQYLNRASHTPQGHLQQKFWFVNTWNKQKHVLELLKEHCERKSMANYRPLIFCNYSNTAYWLHKYLITEGINNIYLSTILKPKTRVRIMRNEIPNTTYPVVTTDGFSSGLDFREFGLVLNYEFPFTYEDYLRRVGRTGRLSTNTNDCLAISYLSHKRDKALFNVIKDSTDAAQCKAYSLMNPHKSGWMKR